MLERRIAGTRDDIDRTQNELSVAKETKEKFEALIENASSRQNFRSEIKSKEDEIKRLKDAKKAKEFGITSMIFSERPWLLLGQDDALVQFVQKRDDFVTFALDEYIDFFVSFLERLRPDIYIERFVGEVPPRFVNETPWGLIRNVELLRLLEKRLEERDTWQGRLLKDQIHFIM